jgi:hypothetical protein
MLPLIIDTVNNLSESRFGVEESKRFAKDCI